MKPERQRHLRLTEQPNPAAGNLDTLPVERVLHIINREDRKIAPAVGRVLPRIAAAVDLAVDALSAGGRMIYLGAGTSGRLGVLDAAECLPTFGTDQVVAVMAGGPRAMFKPTEVSEDDPQLARRDLQRVGLKRRDLLVGISASGRTPYVLGGMRYARRLGSKTVAITCNRDTPMESLADITIAPIVGPEVIAGSTRMKAGTAQKLVLNMLSTATMVRLGRVFSNRMVYVQLKNRKLANRARGIVIEATGASPTRAQAALRMSEGNLPAAMLMVSRGVSLPEARRLLRGANVAALLRASFNKKGSAGL
jgi:N-acetylmuramic acid 6-phosphate etherase